MYARENERKINVLTDNRKVLYNPDNKFTC